MKLRGSIITLSVLALLLMMASSASAATLTVGNVTVAADQTAQVTLEVDFATGIAGAAFTIVYNTTDLTLLPIQSTFFDTFAQQWAGLNPQPNPLPPSDVTVDSQTYDQPLITNLVSGTGTRVAAARAMPADESNKVLFTLSFQHNNPGAVTADTTYGISVISTSLNNTDAGYDAGGETIPMLVTSDLTEPDLTAAFGVVLDPSASPTPIGTVVNGSVVYQPVGCTDTDSDGICDSQDDFPNDPAASVDTDGDGDPDDWNTGKTQADSTTGLVLDTDDDNDGYPDVSDANPLTADAPGGTGYNPATDTRTYDIEGSVSYSGSQTGTLYVKVYDDAARINEIGSTSIPSPTFAQAYAVNGLAAKGTYYLQAFIDVSGGTAGTLDNTEAEDHIQVSIGAIMTGKDMTLEDPAASGWQATIHALGHDFGTNPKDYYGTIGVDQSAFTEEAVTSPPPEATVVMYMYTPPYDPFFGTALATDIRADGQETYSWIIKIDPNGIYGTGASLTSTLSWDPAEFSQEGYYRLREGNDGTGNVVVSDMRTTTSYDVTGDSEQFFTIEFGFSVTIDLSLNAGWNMVSLPVVPDDNALSAIFPDASIAYKYDGFYQSVQNLEPSIGYWVKVPGAAVYSITGQSFDTYSSTLSPGWHMVGAVNGTATPETSPSGNISVMYEYIGHYSSTTEFSSGQAYWVKITTESLFSVDAP